MMLHVIPAGETEVELFIRGADYSAVNGSPDGNIYLFLEEDDEVEVEVAIIKIFETGEPIEGYYFGSVVDGKVAKHVYWVNYMEDGRLDVVGGNLRGSNDLSEMPETWSDSSSSNASGSSQDI